MTVIAGALGEQVPPAPPPYSWASRPDADVAIWSIVMEPSARWTLPRAGEHAVRTLYFFEGPGLKIGHHTETQHAALAVRSDTDLELRAGDGNTELLLLQGRPIAEPVVHYGPFVMNRQVEIQRAMVDYRRTRFGGWPWSSDDPVHAREEGRFAKHVNGDVERMPR